MTRVASLVPYPIFPARMGGQKAIYFFLKYFSRHCDVICYTTKNNQQEQAETFRVKKMLSSNRFRYINPWYFFLLKKDFRVEQITHLIIEHPYYGWLGILLKWFAGVKLIIRSHNIESLRFRSTGKWWWRILWWYEKTAHRCADLNFFITEEDREYAVQQFHLAEKKCTVITYGTERSSPPPTIERQKSKQDLCRQYNLDEKKPLLLYNGAFNYLPNRKGLDIILEKIRPSLEESGSGMFNIIICGGGLPEKYNSLEAYRTKDIVYTGFVQDIIEFYKAADIFINPVADGGGIKTKLVEALSCNCQAVSFTSGASGIPPFITGNKLMIVPDYDIPAFCKAINRLNTATPGIIPVDFYNHFYWDNIAEKAAAFVNKNPATS